MAFDHRWARLICKTIAERMEAGVDPRDDRPFNGFGQQGAATAALANLVGLLSIEVEEQSKKAGG